MLRFPSLDYLAVQVWAFIIPPVLNFLVVWYIASYFQYFNEFVDWAVSDFFRWVRDVSIAWNVDPQSVGRIIDTYGFKPILPLIIFVFLILFLYTTYRAVLLIGTLTPPFIYIDNFALFTRIAQKDIDPSDRGFSRVAHIWTVELPNHKIDDLQKKMEHKYGQGFSRSGGDKWKADVELSETQFSLAKSYIALIILSFWLSDLREDIRDGYELQHWMPILFVALSYVVYTCAAMLRYEWRYQEELIAYSFTETASKEVQEGDVANKQAEIASMTPKPYYNFALVEAEWQKWIVEDLVPLTRSWIVDSGRRAIDRARRFKAGRKEQARDVGSARESREPANDQASDRDSRRGAKGTRDQGSRRARRAPRRANQGGSAQGKGADVR